MRDWVPVRYEPLSSLDVRVVSPAGVSYRFDSFAPNHRTEILDLEPGTWTVYNNSVFMLRLEVNSNSETGSGSCLINFLPPSEYCCFDWEVEGEAWKLTGALCPSARVFDRPSIDADIHVQTRNDLKLTELEYLFCRYMIDAGTSCHRIPEKLSKIPDFIVTLSDQTVPVEFKEFSPNPEEQRDEALLRTQGYGEVHHSEVGHRIAKVAGRARPQLRSFLDQNGDGPGILAIYDSSGQGHADPIELAAFFEGQLTVTVSTNDRSITDVYRKEDRHRAPRERNRILSAIAVLYFVPKVDSYFQSESEEFVANLVVYHNPHAVHPLSVNVLASFGFPQYVVGPAEPPVVHVLSFPDFRSLGALKEKENERSDDRPYNPTS